MLRFVKLLYAALFTALFCINISAFAQSIDNVENESSAPQAADKLPKPASWTAILDTTSQAIEREGILNSELDRLLKVVESVALSAKQEVGRVAGQVEQLKVQLDALGPPPEDGAIKEAQEIVERRNTLETEFASFDARLKLANASIQRTDQLKTSIINQRKQRFFNKIELKTENLFSLDFWGKFISGFNGSLKRFNLLVSDSMTVMVGQLLQSPASQILLILFSIILVFGFFKARSLLHDFAVYEGQTQFGEFKSRFIRFCSHGILPAFMPYLFYRLFAEFDLFTARLDALLLGLVTIVGFTILAASLVDILLNKSEGRSRLLSVSDAVAKRIHRVIKTGLVIAFILMVLNTIETAIVAPLEVAVGLSFAFSIVVAVTCILLLWTLYKDRILNHVEQKELRFWRALKFLSWVVSIVIIGTAIFGYVALSEFLAQQLVFGLLVIGSVWLLLRFVDRNFQPLIEPEPVDPTLSVGEAVVNNSKQALILGNGLINLGIYSAAFILLLLPWGYRTNDFYQIFNKAFFGFEVGGLRFSLATILFALVLFAIGYTITIALRGWLRNRYLPTTGLDIGVSNSISTVLGYIGFIIAAILAISAAGFDLSNLAIVAGALSLGIGFGLQSIVSNFVSGLILLAERPIKAGDWVVTTGGEGTVTKISVRSTEIETFERATIIVPNSTLITDPVTNWTHENKLGRISVAIGVGYDSDPEEVKAILLKCAQENPRILGIPQPSVFFMDFGASSLDFQVRGFLSDINYCLTVQSELRFAILKALREANIEIPYPQRDVHIKSGDPA